LAHGLIHHLHVLLYKIEVYKIRVLHLEIIHKNWYIQLELRWETASWEVPTTNFIHNFNPYEDDVIIDIALQLAKENLFQGIDESEGSLPDWMQFAE